MALCNISSTNNVFAVKLIFLLDQQKTPAVILVHLTMELRLVENYQYHDIVQFSCNTGYQLAGSSSRTCQTDNNWDGTQPTCQRKLSHTARFNSYYYMTSSVSGQDSSESRALIGYPSGQDGTISTARDRPLCSCKRKNFYRRYSKKIFVVNFRYETIFRNNTKISCLFLAKGSPTTKK